MRVELKPFQQEAVDGLLRQLEGARFEASRGNPQAIVLASPTGSGKTITMAAMIESCLTGKSEVCEADRDLVFIWFSDSPELNEQSREKIFRVADGLRPDQLIVVDARFDEEFLKPGTVNFLNTQKFSRNSLLVRTGDDRRFSLWATIRNTVERDPSRVVMIVDEAHRGMGRSTDSAEARTIVQKLVGGSQEASPIPIVIGMSATPQRFDEFIGAANRTRRPVIVDVSDVRESGLLKERIILFNPSIAQPADITLLRQAVRSWRELTEQWRIYCEAEGEQLVRPMLVVQLEDGTADRITKSDVEQIIEAIRSEYPRISSENIAHCFEVDSPVDAAGLRIRKVDPSRLQDELFVDVVLFKRALSTGWDCPRAEVMMSFRRATDHTLITQLVGRMVRAPLARRIDANQRLNDVELYLPHYDAAALSAVVERLTAATSDDLPPIDVESAVDQVAYNLRDSDWVTTALASTPSYVVERARKVSNTKRLLRLSFLLAVRDEIALGAYDDALALLVETLAAERDRLARENDYVKAILETGRIRLSLTTVRYGEGAPAAVDSIDVPASAENIQDLFERVGRRLAPGEGLHTAFLKRLHRSGDTVRTKLDFVVIASRPDTIARLEAVADERAEALFREHKRTILELPEGRLDTYRKLQGLASEPKTFPLRFPSAVFERAGSESFEKHAYADKDGVYRPILNNWERAVLRNILSRDDVVGWLRNTDRRPYAVCIPYNDRGKVRGFYPDFSVVRANQGNLEIDIFEPHDIGRDDTWRKVKGLASYANKHGRHFGRLIVGYLDDATFRYVDANRPDVREKLMNISSNDELRDLTDSMKLDPTS